MKTVAVLLSTYNGEKYLKEQIDSLFNQKGVNVFIVVRDDGSTDSTVSILSRYSKLYDNFSYYIGENCGPAKSFFELLAHVGKADFYAFCDQDDVWDNDKLLVAVRELGKFSKDMPNLYHSNLRIVDVYKNFYRNSHDTNYFNDNKYSCLVENLCTGCTAVFNYKAKEIISNNLPEDCTMHDAWIYMVCKMMGNVFYDRIPHLSYRQHGNNVVGTYLKRNRYKIIRDKLRRLFNFKLQPRYKNALNFYKCYNKYLDEYDNNKILKLINYKQSINTRISLLLDPEIKASTTYGNIRLRLHIIWGTL